MTPPRSESKTRARRTPRSDTLDASFASTPVVRRKMQWQATRDTMPELAVRRLLHGAGLRYRVDSRPLKSLPRRADIVFGPSKVAVFIDGCFWHGCPTHGARRPGVNAKYWGEKIAKNQARDEDTDARLEEAGWVVVRVWEHEPAEEVADLIRRTVAKRRAATASKLAPPPQRSVRRGGGDQRQQRGKDLSDVLPTQTADAEDAAPQPPRAAQGRHCQSE